LARVRASNGDKIYKIEEWLGVNENPEGDTGLRLGEAASMTNFKITNNKKLQKRPGTQNVANLLFSYDMEIAGEPTTILTETITSTATFQVYPHIDITDGGLLFVTGTPVTVNYSNLLSHAGEYYRDNNGVIYQLGTCDYAPGSGATAYRWNKWSCNISGGFYYYSQGPFAFYGGAIIHPGEAWAGYTQLSFNNYTGTYSGTGSFTNIPYGSSGDLYVGNGTYGVKYHVYTDGTIDVYHSTPAGPYWYPQSYSKGSTSYGYVYGADGAYPDSSYQSDGGTYYWYDSKVLNSTYTWKFYRVSITANPGPSPVRGIWSGRIGDEELLCAACDGRLWLLSESGGVWTKGSVGQLNTDHPVHFFAFNGKLYMMNGSQYMVFDGSRYATYTYAAAGTEPAGSYYMTINSVNYKFTLASALTASDTLVFSTDTNTLEKNGVPMSYTTGTVTTETNLTGSLVTATPYQPVSSVEGYRPLVAITRTYDGGQSVPKESVNMLNGKRRVWFSPDGSHTTFTLPEKNLASVDYAKVIATGAALTISSSDLGNGTVTFSSAPPANTDSIEIGYSVGTSLRSQIEAMTLAEFYNGDNDNRIFVYGDGSNKSFYSGLDYNGRPTAEYFPDLNVVHIGDANTPIYDLLRHYNELIAFKDGSAYRIKYGQITKVNGEVIAAFYVETINKGIGGSGYGQAQLVENHPRTLDGRSIYEWVPTTTSGGITSDQRNAQRISQKVEATMRELDLTAAMTFYDKIGHEYYIVGAGVAIVQNTENGAWYIYRDFPAVCMIIYRDEIYYGTADGYIRHLSHAYRHDCGAEIACYWESGAESFGKNHMRKYTDELYIVPKQEDGAFVNVTLLTDESSSPGTAQIVATGFFSFLELGFRHLSFNVCRQPKTHRKKIKARGYTWLKLIFSSVSCDTTATLLSASIKVRETGKVR
jgi:hypothetical protein